MYVSLCICALVEIRYLLNFAFLFNYFKATSKLHECVANKRERGKLRDREKKHINIHTYMLKTKLIIEAEFFVRLNYTCK